MRFRPANIRLINRRSLLPWLLLALSSNKGKSKDNNKNNPIDVQRLTGSLHIREGLHKRVFEIPSAAKAALEIGRLRRD